MTDLQELTVYLETQTCGDTVKVTFIRDGEERSLQVTLDELP